MITNTDAILYTLRELGRRAGADANWIAAWRVVVSEASITLYPDANLAARIVFPLDRSKAERFERLREQPASIFEWPLPPAGALLAAVPNFIVPFEDRSRSGGPLFTRTAADVLECQADILTATLWSLARMEERHPIRRDEHDRISARSSAAFRDGYLERPIVDEYGLGLAQAIIQIVPRWLPIRAPMRLKLSHDVDQLGIPARLRSTMKHLYHRNLRAATRDVLAAAGLGRPAYLHSVFDTARISQARGLHSAFYWTAGGRPGPYDRGYRLQHPQIRAAIEQLTQQGCEIGLHPAHSTYDSEAHLEEEVSQLRRFVGNATIGGRHHYLRWRPATWAAWERAGLAYDSTVGYHDGMGFRAGTAVPYHPWLLEEERECKLLEIPLVLMDCTPMGYMGLTAHETLARLDAMISRCQVTGGVFTLLWHNASVIDPPYAKLYPQVLDRLRQAQTYDYSADLPLSKLPHVATEPVQRSLSPP